MMKFSSIVFVLSLCSLLQPLAMDIFVSEIPLMMQQLHVNANQIQIVLTSFMLANGIAQLGMGALVNKKGVRYTILLATFFYSVASLACVVIDNIIWLSLFRFFQGVMAAACLVCVFTTTSILFSNKQAARVFSYLGIILAVTPMLAPILGVLLTMYFSSWHAMFYFLAIFSLLVFIYNWMVFPAIEQIKPTDEKSTLILYIEVLTNKTFMIYSLSATLAMSGLLLYFSIGSIFVVDLLGYTSMFYSLLFAVNAIIYMLGNYLSSVLVYAKTNYFVVRMGNTIIAIGAALMLIGQLVFGLSMILLVLTNGVITLGAGLMIGVATSQALTPLKNTSGIASGIFGTLQYGGAALIAYGITRFPINTLYLIGVPMLTISLINISFLLRKRETLLLSEEEADIKFSN